MNNFTLLTITLTASLLGNVFRKLYTDKYPSTGKSRHIFNLTSALSCALFLFILNGKLQLSAFTLFLGILFGLLTATQQIFLLKSLQCGPLSYTSLMMSFSTVIPAFSGLLFFGESIVPIQIIGMILMGICMFLSTNFEGDEKEKSIKWIIYCGVTFFTTGFIGLMQKIHQTSVHKEELGAFLITAFIISAIFSGICSLTTGEKAPKIIFRPAPLIIMILCGITAAIVNQLNLYLSGVMDSAVFFPIVNGGTLVLTVISSLIFFKERPTIKQWIGIFLGIVAVILLCNPFN